MRIAVIADIHGNSAALDAVLAEIARTGADVTVNLGDCLSGPLDAAGTAGRLMAADLPTVAGNHDRWLVDPPGGSPGAWERPALAQIGAAEKGWLATLPAIRQVEGVLLCHGTPAADTEGWLDTPAPGGLEPATPQAIEAAAAGHGAEAFLCAHTHVPRIVRLADGRLILNPGSVGCPAWADRRSPASPRIVATGAPDARFGIIERRGGVWLGMLCAVPYDAAPMIARAAAAGEADWCAALATGRIAP
jgi:predicted phosphodiesterase